MKYLGSLIKSVVLTGALIACGCQPPPGHPPQNVAEILWRRDRDDQRFTHRMIALHNVNRVLSPDVAADDRLASLAVVEGLGALASEAPPALATALSEPATPREVRLAILAYLVKQGYPGLVGHVVALPHARDPQLRSAILEWIQENPTPGVLAEIVKLWASEGRTSVDDEVRYRQVVAKITGKKWDEALLDALNSTEFFARGSAIDVLGARVPEPKLRKTIAAMKPQTQAVLAMQYSLENFGCLPKTRGELLGTVIAYAGGPIRLARAAAMANKWQADHGYLFNIRDLHLLSNLAGDPLREMMPRRQLKLELATAISARQKPRPDGHGGLAGGRHKFRRGRLVDFEMQFESLSMADLWNLALINEMVTRLRFKLAIRIIIARDRADRQTQWAGLMTYEHGKAEAKLYHSAAKHGDDTYVPSERMLNDSANCLCYFVGHFNREAINPITVGPSNSEMEFSRITNLYGIVLTSLEPGWVNATYFNPQGVVIDVGDFSLSQ